MRELRVLSPTGNLGHSPIQTESYYEGSKRQPHFVAADAGSGDVGPSFLGADMAHNPVEWERFDLELLLTTTRERQIPLIIGSAGTNGTRRGVDLFVEIIRDIAARHKLTPFKLASIYADVAPEYLRRRIRSGEHIEGLGVEHSLTEETLARTSHIVAMMGIDPIIRALQMGAEVVVAGRACDDALFAALPILQAYPKGLAFHLGKALECASLVATPVMVKETVLGIIRDDGVLFQPMHPAQRCTIDSVAGHSVYERTDPYTQALPGGMLDMHNTVFEQVDERTTRVTGSQFIPAPTYQVKLEGAGRVGPRAFSIVGLRDPIAIQNVDAILDDVRTRTRRVYPDLSEGKDYRLIFHVYGRNGVMGTLEPLKQSAHELGIVTEIVAADKSLARDLAKLVQYRFLFARYPGQRNSGGGAALIVDEALFPEHDAYEWTIDHLLALNDPCELFPIHLIEIGS